MPRASDPSGVFEYAAFNLAHRNDFRGASPVPLNEFSPNLATGLCLFSIGCSVRLSTCRRAPGCLFECDECS